MQKCGVCGMQLQPEMTICSNCSSPVSTTPPAQDPYNTNSSSSSYMPGLIFSNTTSSRQTPRSFPTPNIYAPADQPSPSSFNHFAQSFTSPMNSQLTRYQKPPQAPHQGRSQILVALIILLALVLIGSGVGLIYYATVTHPAQLHAQASATAIAQQTVSARTTAIVHANATGTAVAQANASATANAQAQSTATALQNIYTQNTKGNPTISSTLDTQTSSHWDVYPTEDGGGCAFTGGAFHASVLAKNYYIPCIAHATKFSNFAMEINMTIHKGDEGGIIFRSNNSDKNFYSFRLKSDGTYHLLITKDNSHTTSLIYDNTDAIKKGLGQTNVLSIILQGNSIYLYVNQKFIGSANDSTYASGSIGVIAVDRQHDTDVSFNNLRVWNH